MPGDLEEHIQRTPLCDTHEHLRSEAEYVERGPDILQNLFDNYIMADLAVAGAAPADLEALLDSSNPDLRARFGGVQGAWDAVRHTGYGQAVRLIARDCYAIDELSADAIEAAQPRHAALRQPGQRLALLRDRANLAHVQTDNFSWACRPDPSGPDFFFCDLSWKRFSCGTPDLTALAKETGVEVSGLDSLREGMQRLFALYGAAAIAVKTQHAYQRTLTWTARTEAEASQALQAYLREGQELGDADRLCLGDWCLARGVELAVAHDLPVKIHTGYYAGVGRMPVERIRPGYLSALLRSYPQARFVLLHLGYPYVGECVALTKHYPNVYADFAWAWSIDPYAAGQALRHLLRAAPINKVFAFGGDTWWPAAAAAYAAQARAGLARALRAEVEAGDLSEGEAMEAATRVMWANQAEVFRLPTDRAAKA